MHKKNCTLLIFLIYFIKLTHLLFSPLLINTVALKGFYITLKKFIDNKSHHTIQNLDSSLNLEKNRSIQVSGAQSQNAKSDVVRRTANFHPSIWGDRFISYTSEDKVTRFFATLVYENYVVKFIIFLAFFATI